MPRHLLPSPPGSVLGLRPAPISDGSSGSEPMPRRRPSLPPHRFIVLGRPWTMRWGLPPKARRKTSIWDSSRDLGCCIHWRRQIILHPSLRSSPALAWETFAHELGHAFGRALKVPELMNHGIIGLVERAFGYFLMDNLAGPAAAHPRRTQSPRRPPPVRAPRRPRHGVALREAGHANNRLHSDQAA